MNHEQLLEQAEFYAVGALPETERAQFEIHLVSGCAECEARLKELEEALTFLPKALPQVAPPAALKERILTQIALEGEGHVYEEAKAGFPVPWPKLAAAMVIGALTAALGWNMVSTGYSLREMKSQVAGLKQELGRYEEMLAFVANPNVQLIHLDGLEGSKSATGKLFWNTSTKTGFFMASGLRPLTEGQIYELWAIADVPVRAGIFTVDSRGYAVIKMEPLPTDKAFLKFAVTNEPSGGTTQPTGSMHLLGALAGA